MAKGGAPVQGVFSSAVSLSVTTIGAGVLAIPSLFEQSGIYFVFLVLIAVAALTVLSIDYLVLCVDHLNLKSYEDISRELLGRSFEEAIRWVLIVYSVGIAAGYVVVVGEIVTPLIPFLHSFVPFLSTETHVVFFLWFLLMMPLSCVPQINHLEHMSLVAISSTFLISGAIVYRYYYPFSPHEKRSTDYAYFPLSSKALVTLPVMFFSFDCQSLVFSLYTGLTEVTRSAMTKVTTLSVTITGSVYFIVGYFGYISNTPHITGNILKNYSPLSDNLMMTSELLYTSTVMIAYVLVLLPCRDAVFILMYGYSTTTHDQRHSSISYRQILIVSVVLSVLSFLLALKAKSIVFLIALLGSVCSSILCFLYPAAFRISLHVRGIKSCTPLELFAAWLMMLIGVVGGIVGRS
ncbi:amino acid permease [Strigomonas culicis]|uniref:Amino acid permease n=1 Tax=Strigomonas culicis TaxID=28005 RepID=S9VCQ6_9TRYP|nr:amino acid permease [Strigomonas culicis]|eukprot:EPY20875.1 amino acid permease [Strigomonas culicis]